MKKINKKKVIILVGILLVVMILLLLIVSTSNLKKENEEVAELSKEVVEEEKVEKMREMTERDRVDYYFTNFLDYIESDNYGAAYDLLYPDFKDNYFPTLAEFERYIKAYFPSSALVEFTNIERLNNIYVLWVDIEDFINGDYGRNFSMNVVIQEYGYNDYKLSFSVDSAQNAERKLGE